MRVNRKCFGHDRDQVRLGKGPFRVDRERRVLVGELLDGLRQEKLARHRAHRLQHVGGAHAPARYLVVHHGGAKVPEVVWQHAMPP